MLVLAGCGDRAQACTLSDCDDGVLIELPELSGADDLTARTCVDDVCTEQPISATPERVSVPLPKGASAVAVTVRVTDPSGRVLVEAAGRGIVSVTHPNGPDCPPECRTVGLRVEGARLV